MRLINLISGERTDDSQVPLLIPVLLIGAFLLTFLVAISLAQKGQISPPTMVLGSMMAVPAGVLGLTVFSRFRARVRQLFAQITIWHWLWFVLFLSQLTFRLRATADAENEPLDAWALFRVGLTFAVACYLCLTLARRMPWLSSMFRGIVGILTIFTSICIVSTLWSVYPAWTLYRSFEYVVCVALLAAVLFLVRDPKQFKSVMDWTYLLFALHLSCSWLTFLLLPSRLNDTHRLNGIFPLQSANSCGTVGALLALIALARLFPLNSQKINNQLFYWAGLGFGCASMVMAKTRNAILGFVVAVAVMLILSKRTRYVVGLAVLAIAMYSVGPINDAIQAYMQRGETAQVMDSLSGRTFYWELALTKVEDRPFTGLGAYCGRFAVLNVLGYSQTATLHSDFVEVLLGTGITGFIPFILALGLAWYVNLRVLWRRLGTPLEQQVAYEALTVLVLLTVHAAFNTELSWHAPMHYFAILGFTELLRRFRLQEGFQPDKARPLAVMQRAVAPQG